ncbi:MAG: hypothetical protein IPL98_15535 [Saprospiraceae bacterium]|nr:hypothetical protein [Saprospiraceae bacterium]
MRCYPSFRDFSCGKNDDSPVSIVGKWNIVRSVDIETSSSIPDTTISIYKSGSYIDFNAGGTVSVNLIDDSGIIFTGHYLLYNCSKWFQYFSLIMTPSSMKLKNSHQVN